MIVSQAIRFGRRLAIPSKRQIIHEMRMLQAEAERREARLRFVPSVVVDAPAAPVISSYD